MESEKKCPCCSSNKIKIFLNIKNVPVNSVINIKSYEDAVNFTRGNISLGFCKSCGFIYNTEYNPELVEYSSDCEESQGYSPTFNAFAKELAAELVEKYNLRNKKIVEVGCGKGEFLKLLCDMGQNQGIGFDPAYLPGRGGENASDSITFIKDYYSQNYSNYHGDMICCRMTLEHIHRPAELVKTVRLSIRDQESTVVFFQVPEVVRIMRDSAFEDIYYEHCSYFSTGSLARLFRSSGFDILDLRKAYK
jgi:SAM-dependent methyltransferase